MNDGWIGGIDKWMDGYRLMDGWMGMTMDGWGRLWMDGDDHGWLNEYRLEGWVGG